MSSPSWLTYDGDVANGVNPRRPGIGDVGGAAKLDDQQYPPDPETMPTAADENQQERVLVGLARLAALATLYVKYSAGVPSVYAVIAPGTLLQASDFTVVDTATGTVTITCPATKIPPPTFFRGPWHQNSTGGSGSATITGAGDGFVIYLRNSTGALTDLDFVFDWC